MSHESLDQWIGRMNEGDVAAVERVFLAYEPYLRIAIRRRLSPRLRSKVDSGDIVQSVFADLVRGVRDGGWHFAGRPQLQALLRRIAWRRLADRYQKHAPALKREQSLEETPSRSLFDAAQTYDFEALENRVGWTGGAGIEWAPWNEWSIRLEYDYYGFGTRSVFFNDSTIAITSGSENIKQNIQVVLLGVNFHPYPGP